MANGLATPQRSATTYLNILQHAKMDETNWVTDWALNETRVPFGHQRK